MRTGPFSWNGMAILLPSAIRRFSNSRRRLVVFRVWWRAKEFQTPFRHRPPCPPPGATIAPPAAEVKRAVHADEAKIGQGPSELPILSTREPRRREVLQRLWRAPRGADNHPRAALLHAAASCREDSCVPERAQGRAQARHGPLRRRRA